MSQVSTAIPVQASPGQARADRLLRWALRTSQLAPVRLDRNDWLLLAAAFLVSRVGVVAIGLIGASLFPQVGPHHTFILAPIGTSAADWLRIFVHFDSGWYVGVSHGYTVPSSGNPNWLAEWAFFPLYPLFLRPISFVVSALHLPINPDYLAGIVVSNAALFAALVYLYRLATSELSVVAARRTVVYLLIFPASVFLSAVYPESLFLLLTVGAFFHARRRQWALAGLFAAGAMLTRPVGPVFLLPLGLEFAASLREHPARWRELRQGLWLSLPLVALGCYALYSHALTGYWLAFAASESVSWGHRLTPPVYPLVRYLLSPVLGNAFSFDFSAVNFAAAVLFLVLIIVAWRRLPPAYGLWILLSVLVPLSTSGHYMFAMVRYMTVVFPGFMALAAWSVGQRWTPTGTMQDELTPARRELRDRAIVMPSLLLFTVYVVMFTNGIWAGI